MALNQNEFQKLKAALNFACTMGRISADDCDAILTDADPSNQLAEQEELPAPAPVEEPAAPVAHCQRCGRAQGDPANATCDMQPCPFVVPGENH